MQSSNAPSKIAVPFAQNGDKQPIPVASQIGIADGRASFNDGFPPITRIDILAGGVPPFGTDFNGILYDLSNAIRWENSGGRYAYNADYATAIGGYPKGALLATADYSGYWQNTVENNTSNPDAGGAGWIPVAGAGSDYALDTGTANAYAATYSPAVITLKDGMTLKFKAGAANTGVSTFSPNGLAAKPIVGSSHAALQGGEIAVNGDVWLQWNSSIGAGSWVMLKSSGGGAEASQADAESGSSNTKWMSPLRVFQAIRSASALATETLRGVLRVGTQSEVNAGALDDVAVTPKKLRAGFSMSIAANGYIALPTWLSGLIIQWGRVQTDGTGQVTFTLPISFQNEGFVLVATRNSTGAYEPCGGYFPSKNTGYLKSSVLNNTFSYVAIGN